MPPNISSGIPAPTAAMGHNDDNITLPKISVPPISFRGLIFNGLYLDIDPTIAAVAPNIHKIFPRMKNIKNHPWVKIVDDYVNR